MSLDKASGKIHKIIDPVVRWTCNFGMYALVVMVAAVVADVLMRVLAVGIPGLNEVQIFMMVAVTFLSVAYVGVKKGHIIIELLVSKLSAPHRAISKTINDVFGLGIVVIIAWRSVPYAIQNLPKHTAVLHLPLTWAIFLVTFGAALLSIVLLADLLEHLSEAIRNCRRSSLALIAIVPLVIFTIPIWLDWLPWAIAPITAGLVGLGFMLALMFSGLAIAYAMMLGGFIGVSYLSSWPAALSLSGFLPYLTTANYFFIVIPLFILMGSMCGSSGISAHLFDTADKWMGQLSGGLAMATVGACAAFGAVCGDTLAAVGTMGKVSLPEMKKHKYPDRLSTGSVAAGATLGIMIPPSIVFIFYAIIAEQSIGRLFIAGIFPGILIASLMMTAIYIQARRDPVLIAASHDVQVTFREKLISLKGTLETLLLFILVIGGIYGGIFTPVEAGAIGAAGSFLIGLVRKMITRRNFAEALLDAARICGMLLPMLIGVGFMGAFLGQSHLPIMLGDYIVALGLSRWLIFAFIMVIYMILGCIMNIIPAMLMSLPIFMPTVLALGFDPIWFGVIMVLMVMIGQITPPVGIACFVVKGMAGEDVPLSTVFKGIFPLWGCMVVGLVLLALFPQIALFLPVLMRGG